MCTYRLVGMAAFLGVAAGALPAEGAPGVWARKYALKPGYVRDLAAKRIAAKNPKFAQAVVRLSTKLNAAKGKLAACWDKARLALTNLAASAVHRPRLQLGRILASALAAFERGIEKNQFRGAALSLEAAQYRMRRAFDAFQRRIDWSIRWLRKGCSGGKRRVVSAAGKIR